jgi:organic radical activating enzyme
MSEQADHSGIRVAELFYSLQGEGLYVGVPSIFLRMFGCNFTCSGFSMPRGDLSTERFDVDPDKYKAYHELPLVHTGCDSYASWDPRFKHLSPWKTFEEIVDEMAALLPDCKFSRDKHLILTGGEPLLWQSKIPGLLNELWRKKMRAEHITFETNGTQVLEGQLKDKLRAVKEVVFSISSKLPSSGEKWDKAIRPEAVKSYLSTMPNVKAYFKWVISHPDDVNDIKRAIRTYKAADINIPVYLMPAGGTTVHYNENEKWVAELAKENGWRYSPRIQVEIWKNAWGT